MLKAMLSKRSQLLGLSLLEAAAEVAALNVGEAKGMEIL